MTPAEHYRQAERRLTQSETVTPESAPLYVAQAQAHATLAHAGALVQAHSIAIRGLADPGESRHGHTPRDPSPWHTALYGGAS